MWLALLAWVPDIIIKILAFLGIGIMSVAAFNTAFDAIISNVQSNISGIPADVLALMAMSGVTGCISLILSAYVTGLGIKATMMGVRFLRK